MTVTHTVCDSKWWKPLSLMATFGNGFCEKGEVKMTEHLCTQQVNCTPSFKRPPTDSVPVTLAPK